MNLRTVISGAILALGVMSATGAFAQGAGTSCADFTAMAPAAQDKVISDLTSTPSLTTTATTKASAPAASASATTSAGTKAAAGPTLTSGAAVSACQATPTASLQDALSKAGIAIGAATTAK